MYLQRPTFNLHLNDTTLKLGRIRLCIERKPTANMGFAIAGVLCFVDTSVLNQSVVLRRNCSANHPRHRKPLNRYGQVKQTDK